MRCIGWTRLALVSAVVLLLLPAVKAAGPEKTAPGKKPSAPKSSAKDDKDEEYYELFRTLADVIDQVERNYVTPVDRKELLEAAIQGVLQKLDPYSNYIPPEKIDRFRTELESKFGGVGIQVTMENGHLKVISPIVGSPAYRAGVIAGDEIVEIEGKPVRGMSLDDAIRLMKGPPGTSVTFKVLHPGQRKPVTITVTREIVRLETVLGVRRDDQDRWEYFIDPEHGIAYIRLTAFGPETARDLRQVLSQLTKDPRFRALILDLRFNPGGLLSAAVRICDMFLPEGKIVSVKDRHGRERVWRAKGPGTFKHFPMVVLVNRYSASASEIVSACLQDHGRALIVGERTWGKGSVQNVIQLQGGRSALKLTTAAYFRPSGKNIHRHPGAKPSDTWGVMPDKGYRLRMSDAELRALVRHRRQVDIVRPHTKPAAVKKEPAGKPSEAKADGEEQNQDANKQDKPKQSKPKQGKNEQGKKDSGQTAQDETKPDAETKFVDRHLQKAIEYLIQQLQKQSATAKKS